MSDGEYHQDPDQTRWMRTWRLVQDYLPWIVAGLGGAGVAVAGFLANLRNVPAKELLREPLFIWFLALLVLQILGGVYVTFRRKRWSKLYTENQALTQENRNQTDLIAGFEEVRYDANSMLLRAAADEMDLDDRARISYYEPYGDRGFILKGRYSANSRYNRKSARKYLSKGTVIGRCYDRGDSRWNLPDPHRVDDYVVAQGNLGLTAEQVASLTMRSRTYWTKRVEGADGRGILGVIVLEHESANQFRGASPHDAVGPVAKLIGHLKHTMGGFAPDQAKARRSDF